MMSHFCPPLPPHHSHGALADAGDGVDLLEVAGPDLLAKGGEVRDDLAEGDGLELGLCGDREEVRGMTLRKVMALNLASVRTEDGEEARRPDRGRRAEGS